MAQTKISASEVQDLANALESLDHQTEFDGNTFQGKVTLPSGTGMHLQVQITWDEGAEGHVALLGLSED